MEKVSLYISDHLIPSVDKLSSGRLTIRIMPFICSGSKSVFKSKSDVSEVHDLKTRGQAQTRTSDKESSNFPCYVLKSRFKYGQTCKGRSKKPVLKNGRCADFHTKYGGSNLAMLGTLTPESPSPRRLPLGTVTVRTRLPFAEIDTNKFTCNRCGQQFIASEDFEAHHISQHAVTELPEGRCTRSVIEKICSPSLSQSEPVGWWIQTVLKVNNLPKSVLKFNEHRLKVQTKASQLSSPHPKLLADGNELMRFHTTKVECSLAAKGYLTTCSSKTCSLCQILRFGFSCYKAPKEGQGIITTSSTGRALQLVDTAYGNKTSRKALILCRVIAGKVYTALDRHQEQLLSEAYRSRYDSVATCTSLLKNREVYEELWLLNPAAVLPCFVIICKL